MTVPAITEADVRLPRPPGVLRRWFAQHTRAVDVTIVVCYLFGVALGTIIDFGAAYVVVSEDGSFEAVDPVSTLPSYLVGAWAFLALARVIVVSAALLLRRRYPMSCLIAVLIVTVGYHGVQEFATAIALLFMLYAVAVYRSAAAGWVGYGIAVVGTVARELVSPSLGISSGAAGTGLLPAEEYRSVSEILGLAVMTAVWYLVVVMIAINLGNRRRYLAALVDRAHQLARERDQLAQLAVAEERSRFAREMHDIVAHSVSVMIALSEGASRAMAAAPDAAADAMVRSAETGRTALAEMRRLLGALHESDDEQVAFVPQPGVDDLPDLVRSFRDAGVLATLSVTGEDPGDRGQDLAVYRVVQEGLTNVLRYAGSGTRAQVEVHRDADRTVVQVRDCGRRPGHAGPTTGLGSGRGIAGLRERARVFGGTIEVGPIADGAGWRLYAELPVRPDARERRDDATAQEHGASAPSVEERLDEGTEHAG